MRALIDTHVLLWWLDDPAQLSAEAVEIIGKPSNNIYVSVITHWEISVKSALGKLQIPCDFDGMIQGNGFIELALTGRHVRQLANLPGIHRDPFDRMLVCQSIAERLVLITRDRNIMRYNADFIVA